MNVQVLVGGALRRVSRPIGCSEQNLGVAAAALGQIPWHRVFHSWDLCIHPAKPYGIPNDLTPPHTSMLTGEGVNQSKNIRSKAPMRRGRGHKYMGGSINGSIPKSSILQ